MNPHQTAVGQDHAAVASRDASRLPWTAPVLGVYDAARLTLGQSVEDFTDGLINTRTS